MYYVVHDFGIAEEEKDIGYYVGLLAAMFSMSKMFSCLFGGDIGSHWSSAAWKHHWLHPVWSQQVLLLLRPLFSRRYSPSGLRPMFDTIFLGN
ncbi:hypothetical protein K493DRAFT_314758 [Basidiobolus meristosporus CBS 931.73]|uniref:Uncharacterized protein n=1 Tax=Basidiobolus meristosporus CBS 931.73 TaxID=1314790 RepID=A0A1Y1YCZ2_9FUNG|nr:hypothetical protein K493DRAFT_314758 [Basidiobolus meristosporus CBS 931.73]|eukprot:ORX95890.1 hypothetical protein K493DRAFT_314758 [Basidiobolus meristosporus CBS 931.73]